MTCHHSRDDRSCSSHPDYVPPYEEPRTPPRPIGPPLFTRMTTTPDKARYEIDAVERVGAHLVLRVLYPNCNHCAYEGKKVMVFLNVPEAMALRWREIDPHFRSPKVMVPGTSAPSPAARFPASAEGWTDALNYARSKVSR